MNKYFKKIFSVFLLLAVGTIGVVITTQNVDAATASFDISDLAVINS